MILLGAWIKIGEIVHMNRSKEVMLISVKSAIQNEVCIQIVTLYNQMMHTKETSQTFNPAQD